MLIYVLITLVFVAMFYATYEVAINHSRTELYVAKTSDELNKIPIKSLAFTKDRASTFQHVLTVIRELTYKVTPVRFIRSTEDLLIQAGQPRGMDIDSITALKMSLAGIALVVTGVLSMTTLSATVLLKGAMVTAFAFFLPDMYLYNVIAKRKASIRRQFPDFLDLLAVSVQAGIGFDIALKKLTASFEGPLVDEFNRMIKEIQLGISRKDAFRNMADRVHLPEINAFVQSMIMADSFGVSIAKILKQKATEMRQKRRQRAEEIAMKAPVKILFPLIFFIFPVLLIVILGPAMIRVYTTLF